MLGRGVMERWGGGWRSKLPVVPTAGPNCLFSERFPYFPNGFRHSSGHATPPSATPDKT